MEKSSSVTEIKGVGEKTCSLLAKLNIHTTGDLLAAYPRDYETYGEFVEIARLSPGSVCAVHAAVSGSLQLTFYNMPFLKKTLKRGGFYIFRGMVQSRGTARIMEQPKIFSMEEYQNLTGRLIPR